MFVRFDVIHERDGQTDGRTDRHCMTAKTALASHRAVKIIEYNVPIPGRNADFLIIILLRRVNSWRGFVISRLPDSKFTGNWFQLSLQPSLQKIS